MIYTLIALSSFFASLLAFYSGFGLGTLLMPIIALFFPLPIAIGVTAFVHLSHNLLKTILLWKHIDWRVVLRFGMVAWVFAFIGALVLQKLSFLNPIAHYFIFSYCFELSLLHIIIGALLILYATLELFPKKAWRINNLFMGGALSGFFGGLSGYQGAFRSAFLVQAKLLPACFIGTGALIAVGVDSVRLSTYLASFGSLFAQVDLSLVGIAVGSALSAVIVGITFLHKVTNEWIQRLVILLLYLVGVGLMVGVI